VYLGEQFLCRKGPDQASVRTAFQSMEPGFWTTGNEDDRHEVVSEASAQALAQLQGLRGMLAIVDNQQAQTRAILFLSAIERAKADIIAGLFEEATHVCNAGRLAGGQENARSRCCARGVVG
jgi:hypothetical protein